jgi:hypothetical protein
LQSVLIYFVLFSRTDTFQVFVMFAGMFAVIIKGSMRVGGFDVVWKRAYDSGRIEFFE